MNYFTAETAGAAGAFLERGFARYVDILRRMVGVNSHTFNRRGVNALADMTAEVFSGLGFSAERIPSVNELYGDHLVMSRPGSGGSIIGMVSHLDTVFSPEEEKANGFSWRVEDDRAYGPGTVDIKGGTVVALMTLEAIRHAAPDVFDAAAWILLFDASEETESDDFGALCRSRLSGARACLVFEAGTCQNDAAGVVASRKGRAEFRITSEGRGAHAGVAHHRGGSAIRQLAEVIPLLENITDYGKECTVNVGTVRGGTQINRVPHEAEALAEMRAFDPVIFEQGIEAVLSYDGRSSVTSADGSFACRTRVELTRRVPPWPVNPGSDELVARWQAAAGLLGLRVEPERRGGLSDGNFTWDIVPTLDGLGPAGGNPHCSEHDPSKGKEQEYVILSSLVPKATLNAMALIGLIRG